MANIQSKVAKSLATVMRVLGAFLAILDSLEAREDVGDLG